MYVADAAGAERALGAIDGRGDLVRGLDVVDLDVDHPDADADIGAQVRERLEIRWRPVRQLEDQVIGVQLVQERDERPPGAGLDRLPAVVAEAEMHGPGPGHRVEHAIDRRGGEGRVGGIAGDVGLVHLNAVAHQIACLRGERVGDRQGQAGHVVIVRVEQGPRQHVRAGQRELEGTARDGRRARAVFREIERPLADRANDDARGLAAEPHLGLRAERRRFLPAHGRIDAAEPPHEVVDHPVGIRMTDVEAIELAVGGQIDARLPLNVEDDTRGVDQRLFARQGCQPVGHWIRADRRGEDPRRRRARIALDRTHQRRRSASFTAAPPLSLLIWAAVMNSSTSSVSAIGTGERPVWKNSAMATISPS